MIRNTFKQVETLANSLGICIQRKGKGYEYWNRDEGGGTVGEASTLREAIDDFINFVSPHILR